MVLDGVGDGVVPGHVLILEVRFAISFLSLYLDLLLDLVC